MKWGDGVGDWSVEMKKWDQGSVRVWVKKKTNKKTRSNRGEVYLCVCVCGVTRKKERESETNLPEGHT